MLQRWCFQNVGRIGSFVFGIEFPRLQRHAACCGGEESDDGLWNVGPEQLYFQKTSFEALKSFESKRIHTELLLSLLWMDTIQWPSQH